MAQHILTHTVKSGDTLSAIARKFNVQVSDITGFRSGNPNLIFPGEVLNIKSSQRAPSAGQPGFIGPVRPTAPKAGEPGFIGPTRPPALSRNQKLADIRRRVNEAQKQAQQISTSVGTLAKAELATSNVQENVEFTLPSVTEPGSDDLAGEPVTNIDFQKIIDRLTSQAPPVVPNLVSDFEAFRSDQGIPALEGQLNTINADLENAEAGLRLGLQEVEGRQVSTREISQEQLKLRRQAQEDIDFLVRRKNSIIDELNVKNSMVSNLMRLTQQDFQNASAQYNAEFSRNIQMISLIMNYKNQQQAEENRLRDDARSNLNTLVNLAVDSGKNFGDLTDSMQSQITSLETKAGYEPGTFSAFMRAKPNTKIISTTKGVNEAGEDIVTFIYQDPVTGKPGAIETVKTGGISDSGVTSDTKAKDFFTATQLSKGAEKASMSIAEFSDLTVDEANKFIRGKEAEVFLTDENLESIANSFILKLGKEDALKAAEVGTIKITDPKTKKEKNVTLSTDQIEKIKELIEANTEGKAGKERSIFEKLNPFDRGFLK